MIFYPFFFIYQEQKSYNNIMSEWKLVTLTKNFVDVLARGITSAKMSFGADFKKIWSPWLCWRACRSSKIGVNCHLCLLCCLHEFSMFLLSVRRMMFRKPRLQARIAASLITIILVVVMSFALMLWLPTKSTCHVLFFPMKAMPCHLPLFEEIPAVVMMSCHSNLICPKLVVFWCPSLLGVIVFRGVCLYLWSKIGMLGLYQLSLVFCLQREFGSCGTRYIIKLWGHRQRVMIALPLILRI